MLKETNFRHSLSIHIHWVFGKFDRMSASEIGYYFCCNVKVHKIKAIISFLPYFIRMSCYVLSCEPNDEHFIFGLRASDWKEQQQKKKQAWINMKFILIIGKHPIIILLILLWTHNAKTIFWRRRKKKDRLAPKIKTRRLMDSQSIEIR